MMMKMMMKMMVKMISFSKKFTTENVVKIAFFPSLQVFNIKAHFSKHERIIHELLKV